ncbi:MAG: acetyltransferase [Candidatus Acidiferrales bacterium]|jgi:sugar O-acyltransferase (sialic acid O-acetyltransferase NeuD family)
MNHDRCRVIVWGAGGHGKVTVDALLASGSCEVVGILDDDSARAGAKILGIQVLHSPGGLRALLDTIDLDGIAIGIGDNYIRDKKFQEVRSCGLKPVNVIHPSAHLSRFVELGVGVTIFAGATINPGTVIEDNVCVNTAASVDHDNYLERGCHVLPNATLTGTVRVGQFAYIGSGAVVAPNIVIHKYSQVGAGAIVLKDVAEGVVVAGSPAVEIGKQTKRPG